MWEYKVVTVNMGVFNYEKSIENVKAECDKLGKEGWDLVNFQCVDLSTKFIMIFKKQV